MPATRFQFSLRTFFAICTVAALGIAMVAWQYQAYERDQRTVSSVGGSSGFAGFNATFDNYNLTSYRDRRDRPVAYVLLTYDNSPNLPATRHSLFNHGLGGELSVDGALVHPQKLPKLFVNGPYGYTVQLTLSDQDVAALESAKYPGILTFWRDRIEPRLYRIKGASVAGQRDGVWEFRLADNALYLKANYKLGQRHGEWTSYFPDGQVQHRAHFADGKPSGQWEYFDEAGTLIGTLEWEDGFIRDGGNSRGSGGFGGNSLLHGERGKYTGHVYSQLNGGSFFLHGRKLTRPKPDPALLSPKVK
jgi:hypothetical protein